MNQKLSNNSNVFKIHFPKEVDPFEVLEAAGTGMSMEDVAEYVKELIWRSEQGCSQAMRDD